MHDDDFIDDEPEPRFTVAIFGYCGMPIPIAEQVDMEEARVEAARCLRRRRRQGFDIAKLTPGQRWEILCPEDAVMVPDVCGMLEIFRRDPRNPCW